MQVPRKAKCLRWRWLTVLRRQCATWSRVAPIPSPSTLLQVSNAYISNANSHFLYHSLSCNILLTKWFTHLLQCYSTMPSVLGPLLNWCYSRGHITNELPLTTIYMSSFANITASIVLVKLPRCTDKIFDVPAPSHQSDINTVNVQLSAIHLSNWILTVLIILVLGGSKCSKASVNPASFERNEHIALTI